ncbi:MAG: protocatechuate 3,4-dioxygenase subunit alpha [Nocardioidaceae bacterium]|nr:protocatechuate 3,4-dioxygenase subunit alpha [Nocardioidaceae bacterium]NUS51626.1 protocatechuate 3,4-dioxygenase subunit alpha [Nocardioidaceae bacterium]
MTEYTYDVTDVAASAGPTPSQTVGPFFHMALPYDAGPAVVGPERPGALTLHGYVYDGEGAGVPDALVEVWQADEEGAFCGTPGVYEEPDATGFRGFGRSATDEHGHYAFTTVRPGAVPTTDGAAQAPHLAMSVFARGMLRRVVTRVYFAPDDADPLLAAVDEDRRATLLATRDEGGYRFDVRLQGPDETVFLDVFAR